MPLNLLKIENTSSISTLLSLLKNGCIQPVLALLGANSIPENICLLLVLSLCCLMKNKKLHII